MRRLLLTGHLWLLLGVRVFGLTLQLLLQVFLGQMLGAAAVGLFNVFIAWTSSLGEVAAQGQPARLMRKISVAGPGRYAREELTSSLYVITRAGAIALGLLALFLALTNWSPFYEFLGWGRPSDLVLWLTVALVPSCMAFACIRMTSESMKAIGKNVLSTVLENAAYPALVILSGVMLLVLGVNIEMLVLLAIACIALVLTAYVFLKLVFTAFNSKSAMASTEDCVKTNISNKETAAFWGSSVLNMAFLSAPILLMPTYAGLLDIGYFSVAYKLVNFIGVILILLASIYGPKFARAYHSGEVSSLEQALKETQLLSLVLFVPALMVLWLFSESILTLFGEDFILATPYLWILVLGQFFNAATGLPGVLLNMSGAAVQDLQVTAISLLIIVLLAVVLGPKHGAIGVAIAFTAGLVVKNCLSFIRARRHCALLRAGSIENPEQINSTHPRQESDLSLCTKL